MRKLLENSWFWMAMFFANLLCMLTADSVFWILLNALGAFACTVNFNKTVRK